MRVSGLKFLVLGFAAALTLATVVQGVSLHRKRALKFHYSMGQFGFTLLTPGHIRYCVVNFCDACTMDSTGKFVPVIWVANGTNTSMVQGYRIIPRIHRASFDLPSFPKYPP